LPGEHQPGLTRSDALRSVSPDSEITTAAPRRRGSANAPAATKVLVRRLETKLDDVSRAMLAQMRREFSEYDDVPDLERQLLSVRSIATAFLSVAASQRPLDREERQRFSDIGAQAAGSGISLDTLLAGVDLAMRVAWIYTAEEAREMQPPGLGLSALEELGLALLNFVRDLSAVMAQGYRSEIQGPGAGLSGASEVVRDILRRRAADPRRVLAEAREAGLDPDLEYAVTIVLGVSDAVGTPEISAAAAQVASRLGSTALAVDVLEARVPHSVVVAPLAGVRGRGQRENVASSPRDASIVLIVLRAAKGLLRAAESYRGHRPLLAVARGLASPGALVTEADLAVYRLVNHLDTADRQRFVRSVIGPLIDMPASRREPLLKTMEAVESAGGHGGAAETLHVHRKTVQYRQSRVQEVTGLDLRRPADRFRLQLALYILKLSTGTT
jgi:hypothetical protein